MADVGGNTMDLSDFHDTVYLRDGTISVYEQTGAIVKVTGTTSSNRNPCATRLKPLTPRQLSRLIRRAERENRDYQLMHPGEKYCRDCNKFHKVSEFGMKNGRYHWRCRAAESRAQRSAYAAKLASEGKTVRQYKRG